MKTASGERQSKPPLILITGASGYVGGRLVPALESRGCRVRCLARRPEFLTGRFHPETEVVRGDVLNPDSLESALRGVHTAYYLVHSMGAVGDFEEQDRLGARNFARAARSRGIRRVIYLGGLGGRELSPHLASRREVGDILPAEGPAALEFRASIVIGSGSLSFEMIRALVNKLPVMVAPRWVRTETQPIAIEDLIAYLVHGLDFEGGESAVFEIGGPDRMSYGDLMREYAGQIGVRRLMVPVPFLTTGLAPVRGRADRRRQPDHPDRGFRSAGARRAPLLVRALPHPLVDLPADPARSGVELRPGRPDRCDRRVSARWRRGSQLLEIHLLVVALLLIYGDDVTLVAFHRKNPLPKCFTKRLRPFG